MNVTCRQNPEAFNYFAEFLYPQPECIYLLNQIRKLVVSEKINSLNALDEDGYIRNWGRQFLNHTFSDHSRGSSQDFDVSKAAVNLTA